MHHGTFPYIDSLLFIQNLVIKLHYELQPTEPKTQVLKEKHSCFVAPLVAKIIIKLQVHSS